MSALTIDWFCVTFGVVIRLGIDDYLVLVICYLCCCVVSLACCLCMLGWNFVVGLNLQRVDCLIDCDDLLIVFYFVMLLAGFCCGLLWYVGYFVKLGGFLVFACCRGFVVGYLGLYCIAAVSL